MSAASSPEPRLADGGLQVERTSLAWQRTGCSIVVLAAVGIRLGAHLDRTWITVTASVVGLVAALDVLMIIHQTMPNRRALSLDPGTGRVHLQHSAANRGLVMSAAVAAMGVVALIGVLVMASADP